MMLDMMMREFTKFMMIGGMSEAVSKYPNNGISGAMEALYDIVRLNVNDIIKYAIESEVDQEDFEVNSSSAFPLTRNSYILVSIIIADPKIGSTNTEAPYCG